MDAQMLADSNCDLQQTYGGQKSDEGRNMLEVIHDLAPGAGLAFHSAFNGAADMAQGIRALADAGVSVIVDDTIYLEEPVYQDGGHIADAVKDVVARGVSYVAAAGNFGRKTYEAPFRPSGVTVTIPGQVKEWSGLEALKDANGKPLGNRPFNTRMTTQTRTVELHDFDPGPGVDTCQRITLYDARRIALALHWDQPYASIGNRRWCVIHLFPKASGRKSLFGKEFCGASGKRWSDFAERHIAKWRKFELRTNALATLRVLPRTWTCSSWTRTASRSTKRPLPLRARRADTGQLWTIWRRRHRQPRRRSGRDLDGGWLHLWRHGRCHHPPPRAYGIAIGRVAEPAPSRVRITYLLRYAAVQEIDFLEAKKVPTETAEYMADSPGIFGHANLAEAITAGAVRVQVKRDSDYVLGGSG